MIGWLAPDYTPFIAVEVFEAGSDQEMVVDTGFNDYLYLPEDAIAAWKLPFVITTSIALADGSLLSADLYEAQIGWFGAQFARAGSGWPCGVRGAHRNEIAGRLPDRV